MKDNGQRSPANEEGRAFSPTEASLRLQVTDLLLGRAHQARTGPSAREQSDVLQRIEAALEAYGSFFYPPEHR